MLGVWMLGLRTFAKEADMSAPEMMPGVQK